MKNIFIGLIAVWGLFLVSCETREPMVEVIERGLEVSKRQAVFLAKEVENQKGRLPRTYEGGELKHPITGHGFPVFSRECYGICMRIRLRMN